MNENIVLFLKRVEQDAALAGRFNGITNPDEAYALASSMQGGFTKEEFMEAMGKINQGELTQDDLAQMSGGNDTGSYLFSSGLLAAAAAI